MDAVILLGLVQGVMLLLGLLAKNWGKKNQNYYFIWLIGGICVALLSRLLFTQERYDAYPQIWFVADTMAYFIGPLWYLTLRRSTEARVAFNWLEWALLLPALYHLVFLVRIFLLSNEAFVAFEGTPAFNREFYWFSATAILVNAAFLYRSQDFLSRFKDSSFPPLLLNGQRAMLVVTGFWLISFGFSLWTDGGENMKGYDLAFVMLSLVTLGLGLLAIIRPASFYFLTQTYDAGELLALEKIASAVRAYIDEHKRYTEPDFQLQTLAESIGYNPVITSKAINRCMKSSFSDLLNEYRINHFLELAQSEKAKQLTHWAIAQEAGFGNKVSFYNAFKKLKGTTPKNYLSSLAK